MKRTILALAAFGGMLAMGLTACGDDVINVTNEDVYSVVDELDSTACTKDNEGDMALVKPTGKLYACKDGEWTAVNAVEAIQLRCKSEPLKDSTGYKILCDDEEIGVVRNGKDGSSSVGKDGKSAYELAKEAGFKGTEEEWLKTLNGKNGKSAYETAKDNGFKGTEEEWVKTLFGKDGKSAYELAKKSGFDGSEEEWLESLKGKDGKNINADSLSTELSESISKMLIDSLKCKIDTSWTDEAKAEVNVQISCGDGTSIITMPTIIPNKNLKNHYKKHVVVRFPVNTQKMDDSQDVYATMWAGIQGGNFAELTVMEVDSSFEQTGKSFVADMIAANGKPFVTVEETNANTRNYSVVRLEGDIDVTNLMNAFAQLRVTLDMKANMWGANTKVAFNAAVNFDDEKDTVVIDFLTDYKAARVKELLKDKSFAAANTQANKELVAALHISETPDEYPALEHYLPAEMGLNEHFAGVVWPMALLDQPDVQNFNTVYADFRAAFGKSGDFKSAVKVMYDGYDYPMYLVDLVTLLMNRNFQVYNGGNYNGNPELSDSYDSVAIYKFVQAEYKDAYALPEKDKDTVVDVKAKGGYFEYFLYDARVKLWIPVDQDYFGYALSDVHGSSQEKFVELLSGKECNAENAGKSVLFTLNGEEIAFVCYLDDGDYFWNREDNGLNDIYCDNKKAGDYGYTEGYYYRCKENEKENGGLIPVSVSYAEYMIGKPCNSDSKDTLYTIPDEENFYRCIAPREVVIEQPTTGQHVSGQFVHNPSGNAQEVALSEALVQTGLVTGRVRAVQEGYVELYPKNESDFQFIVTTQAGACAAASKDESVVVYKTTTQKTRAICDGEKWISADFASYVLGVCDIAKMKQSKVEHIDYQQWYLSTTTEYAYVKCDCDTVWTQNGPTDNSYVRCEWNYASTLEIELNKACNSSIINDVVEKGEKSYTCTTDGSGTSQHREWIEPKPNEDCPLSVAPDGGEPWLDEPCDYPCAYYGKTYYYSQKTEKWIPLAQGECKTVQDYCEANSQEISRNVEETEAPDVATVCVLADDDPVHVKTLLEEVNDTFKDGERLCEIGANDLGNPGHTTWPDQGDYMFFLDGFTLDGVTLPEVFEVDEMRAVALRYNCTKVTDIQTICSALQSDFINNSDGETSCEHPCVYGGETYYYNFQHKNNDGTYGKWMTLAEMGLTECPAVDDYCDDHNSLDRECVDLPICGECPEECDENGENCFTDSECECIEDNDLGNWNCPDYPFSPITPFCMYGDWQTQV